MIVIVVTGSVAMGKTEACKHFSIYKIPVFDADKEVKNVLKKSNVVVKIKENFPKAVNLGNINKKLLAKEVFKNKEELIRLEKLIYPYLKTLEEKWIRRMIRLRKKIVVFDIPLLFEKSNIKKFDIILVVTSAKSIQKNRALKRKDWDLARLESVLKNQLSDYKKRKLADIVIKTDRGKNFLNKNINQIIKKDFLNFKHRSIVNILRQY